MQSLAVTDVATIRMQTSPLRGEGRSTSATRNTSGGPQAVQTIAFILWVAATGAVQHDSPHRLIVHCRCMARWRALLHACLSYGQEKRIHMTGRIKNMTTRFTESETDA